MQVISLIVIMDKYQLLLLTFHFSKYYAQFAHDPVIRSNGTALLRVVNKPKCSDKTWRITNSHIVKDRKLTL